MLAPRHLRPDPEGLVGAAGAAQMRVVREQLLLSPVLLDERLALDALDLARDARDERGEVLVAQALGRRVEEGVLTGEHLDALGEARLERQSRRRLLDDLDDLCGRGLREHRLRRLRDPDLARELLLSAEELRLAVRGDRDGRLDGLRRELERPRLKRQRVLAELFGREALQRDARQALQARLRAQPLDVREVRGARLARVLDLGLAAEHLERLFGVREDDGLQRLEPRAAVSDDRLELLGQRVDALDLAEEVEVERERAALRLRDVELGLEGASALHHLHALELFDLRVHLEPPLSCAGLFVTHTSITKPDISSGFLTDVRSTYALSSFSGFARP